MAPIAPRRSVSIAVLTAAMIASAMLCSCAREAEPEATTVPVEYTVRGQVTSVPTAGSPASEFQVHHEPIPSFRATWPDGKLGMNSMVMPFPPAEGLSLEGIKPGDIVSVTFEVLYERSTGAVNTYHAIRVEELPADTQLVFGRAEASPEVGDDDDHADHDH